MPHWPRALSCWLAIEPQTWEQSRNYDRYAELHLHPLRGGYATERALPFRFEGD
jgi:hypothetical protein